MKRLCNVGLCLLLMLGMANVKGVKAAEVKSDDIIKNDSTGIPDETLYEKILSAGDDNDDGILTKEEAKQISSFYLNNRYLDNLKGIEYLTNLTNLQLQQDHIRDITALKGLTKLTNLDLSCNDISDITPLQNMTNLSFLYLWENNISDITPLQNMTKLLYFWAHDNNISDISVLKNMKALDSLALDNNNISDLTPLKNLVDLAGLDLDNNNISDISALKSLTNLKGLRLNNNNISNLTPLQNLVDLNEVELSNNNISDLTPLQNLDLLNLELNNNNISDLTPLQNLIKLEGLDLRYNKLTWLPDLKGLVDLRASSTYLSGNKLTEAELKAKMPSHLASNQEWINQNKFVFTTRNLKAVSYGKNKVKLTWDKNEDAEGYIIYRKVGNGSFAYRYMVKGTSFTDTTASDEEFNFYRVYPYYTENGQRVLGVSNEYKYAKGVLPAVYNLQAAPAGKKKVTVTWDSVPNAEGYVIYRKVGNGQFSYRYMVKGTSFTDTTASEDEFNFYRVYPYHMNKGARIFGLSDDYKYAKGILSAVTNLKATTAGKNKVKITWNPKAGAEGYIIYRKVGNGSFVYRYVVKGTSFTDTTASSTEYNFYRVYPYYTENGKKIPGVSDGYKYAKGASK